MRHPAKAKHALEPPDGEGRGKSKREKTTPTCTLYIYTCYIYNVHITTHMPPPPYAWGGARPARLVPIAAVGMRIWATPAWS